MGAAGAGVVGHNVSQRTQSDAARTGSRHFPGDIGINADSCVTNSVFALEKTERVARGSLRRDPVQDIMQEVQNKFLPIMANNNVDVNEVQGAVAVLNENPALMLPALPVGVQAEQLGPVFDKVLEIATNLDLILATKRSIAQRKAAQEPSQTPAQKVPSIKAADREAWEKLFLAYPCTICQDVLAAPVLTDCGHSFCGVCVDDYLQSCVSEDAEVDVAHNCPMCARAITQAVRFEHLMDQHICEAVEALPPCKERADWEERRAAFLKTMRRREGERAQEAAQEQIEDDTVFWTAVVVILGLALSLVFAARR